MSIEALSWALNQAPVEDPAAASVLIALANHAGPDGTDCWPAVSRLCYYTRLSERTVRRHLRDLEAAGVIVQDADTRTRDAKTSIDRRPKVYRLIMDGPTRASFEDRRGGSQRPGGQSDRAVTVTGGSETTDRGVTVTPTGGQADPQTVLEPPTNRPSPATPGSTAKRATRLPDNWEPGPELAAWTRNTFPGFPRSELDKFRDHWKATGGTKVDWDATWRNWCRKWKETARRPAGRPQIAAEKRDGSAAESWTGFGQPTQERTTA